MSYCSCTNRNTCCSKLHFIWINAQILGYEIVTQIVTEKIFAYKKNGLKLISNLNHNVKIPLFIFTYSKFSRIFFEKKCNLCLIRTDFASCIEFSYYNLEYVLKRRILLTNRFQNKFSVNTKLWNWLVLDMTEARIIVHY